MSLIRRFSLMSALALCLGATACSSDSNKADPDVATDTTPPQDVATDQTLPEDLVTDQSNVDLAVPDVAVDTNPADQIPEDTWNDLPRLPAGKTFTTPYAAGAARVSINPDRPISMGGFGTCAGKYESCRISEGVHDEVAASAVAIADTASGEVVIFVGVDTVGMFLYDHRIVHDLVQKAMFDKGIKFEGARLIAAFSHSHSAPDTCGLWGAMMGEVRDEEDYIIFAREAIAQAAVEAFENLQDVEITWGTGTAPNNDDDDPIDDEDVYALRGVKPGTGETVFTLTRWVGHPTAYGSDNRAVTADYVGTFRKKMETELGGIAVYVNGPIGSVYTQAPEGCTMEDVFPEGYQDPDIAETGMDSKAACVGTNLADQAISGLAAGKPLGAGGVKFRHQVFKFHPTNPILINLGKLGPIPIPDINIKDPNDLMDSEFSWVTVGDLNFLTTPGESFPSFADAAKKVLADKGLENTVVLGLAQDWMGYLMTEDQYDNDPDLGYHRGLSPGKEVLPRYLESLQQLVDAE